MKKLVIALVAGGVVFGSVFAFAASLGLTSNNLGSGDAVVASCANPVNVSYTTAYVSPSYNLATVNFTLPAACDTEAGKVTISGIGTAAGNPEQPFIAATGANSVNFAANLVKAEDVTGVHVVITGP